ncbi:hypothetical protein PLESTB_001789100 [Pleodorina starrii]|uniref:Uncharacterized protein n=1 Tax=Pleodorina starrii TaxID=330485 RepID=A0A9W6C0T5_9CHLO|nr:hypothetical protein PLESTM_001759600 [Pleodorina starrii]GLC61668.1 hypothetical protein PLESTB_001789100 [Pleodorina starrii]GLC76511.1 hypothetical protein PLESTF_001790900 [Pleodorina starrii]
MPEVEARESNGNPQPLFTVVIGVAIFALLSVLNVVALLAKRVSTTAPELAAPAEDIAQDQVEVEKRPETTDCSVEAAAAARPLPPGQEAPAVATDRSPKDTTAAEIGLCGLPLAPGCDGQKGCASPLSEPARQAEPQRALADGPDAGQGTHIRHIKTCGELKGTSEYNFRAAGVAAWQPNIPTSSQGVPRVRLAPLPSRRAYGAAGALKQPRGLASCVIREDMPYPPANAEVTFEIRTNTVRHGRRLLRYSASSPLDTIYIKIPNTSPTGLHQPLVQSLSHTIDLGHQRIVVGGGVRPGCALIALDLLDLADPDRIPDPADLGRDPDPGALDLVEGALPRPSWLNALNTVISMGEGGGAALAGSDGGDHDGGAGGGGLAAAAVAAVGAGLSRALRGLGVDQPAGLRVQLQYRGALLEAELRNGGGDPAEPAEEGMGAGGRGWALTLLQPPAPTAPPPPRAAAASAGGVGFVVGLSLAQQILVAPTTVGEAVKISVRTHGLPDLATAAAEEDGDGDGGRYAFAVRGLGRYLPVLGVPAPTTPALASVSAFGSAPGGGVAVNSVGDDAGGPRASTAFAAAVVAAAAVAAAAATGEENDGEGEDGAGAGSCDADADAAAAGVAAAGGAADAAAPAPHRFHQPTARIRTVRSAAVAVRGPREAASSSSSAAAALAAAPAAAEPVTACQYELTVAGLGADRAAGTAAAAASPLLLQLELWQESRRLVVSKPLLLLPPSLSGLAAELGELVRLQQVLQQQQEEEEEEEEEEGEDQEGVAEAGVAPDGGASGSSADQLVSDVGMWLEFVHDAVRVTEATEQPPPATAPQLPRPADGGGGGGGGGGARGVVLLPGSVDLRVEVLAHRRAQHGFAAASLRTGLGLLEAAVQYGSGRLVEHLLADFRALGYGAAEVWAAAAAAAAAANGAAVEASSLLHLAAASGDVATLRAVVELADAAAAAASGGGIDGGGGSCWWLRDGDGLTPLHLLAAAAAAAWDGDGGAGTRGGYASAAAAASGAAEALEWALARGGEGALGAWREARDQYGLTPAGVLATMEAAAAPPPEGAAPRPEPLGARLRKLLPPTGTHPPAVPSPPPYASFAHALAEVVRSRSLQDEAPPDWAADEGGGQGGSSGGGGGEGLAAAQAAGASVSCNAPGLWARCRRRAVGTAALLWASLAGFDAGSVGADCTEAQYQVYVSRRTLTLAQGWVVLHLLLTASAVRRLLADGRRHEVAAPLLYSSGHLLMLVVMRAVPGFRLYLSFRGAWWFAVSCLRISAKLAQLVGLVALPQSTARYVRGGATLVADCVLPALFEPCPLPYALVFNLYDFCVSTVLYLRIGYAADLHCALLRAAFKCGLALCLRLAADLAHRAAFVNVNSSRSRCRAPPSNEKREAVAEAVALAEAVAEAVAVAGTGPVPGSAGKGKLD